MKPLTFNYLALALDVTSSDHIENDSGFALLVAADMHWGMTHLYLESFHSIFQTMSLSKYRSSHSRTRIL